VEKTTIAHLGEGFEFLGFRIQRQTKQGSHRRYVYTWVAKRSLNSIKAKVKTITRQGTNNPLKDCCANSTLRCAAGPTTSNTRVAKQTFSYLQAYTWRRVIGWLRRKYYRTNWKQIRRHLGGWRPRDERTALFDTRTHARYPLPLPRRGYPHTLDPATGDHAGRLTPVSARGEPDAVGVARPVR
jgi:RNA-directed DNA polymerase